MTEVRIQKALADAGVASRRAAEALVAAGRVTVNGRPATVGERVTPGSDRLAVDGRPVSGRPVAVHLAAHKPAGVTSTVRDRHAPRTVLELVPADVRRTAGRLYPVGRLDQDSEGLILLTNDGDWAQRLLHPRHEVEREYAVALRAPLDDDQLRELERGIAMEEGIARLDALRPATPDEVSAVPGSNRRLVWYRAILHQGWRRQLRRMFAAVGAPVVRLVRVRIGTLALGDLPPGGVRQLTPAEAEGVARGSLRRLVVSLDGPGSSGKSSVGAAAAAHLGYRFCDTGLLYRALAWLALERGAALDDEPALVKLVPEIELTADAGGRLTHVRVGGADVTERVRTARVDRRVSEVARHPAVRAALLPRQRRLAERGAIIMAGRDIGTIVLPDADLKLWLQVSAEERARRRAQERGLDPNGEEAHRIADDLRRRDEIDQRRPVAPLRIPEGAVVIESDGNTLEQTVAEVVRLVSDAEARAGAA